MPKRKYTKYGETPVAYECTKKQCKWQGTEEQKTKQKKSNSWIELVCPKCGNKEFYGLIVLNK
jgi:predicted nucleic-acid-binding Zn-ribbon protein